MEEVCIIGGGPTGILSAKLSLSYGMKPFILEKSSTFGGLWKADENNVGVWNTLHTNINKYAMTFSDHLWPENAPAFPPASQYFDYLSSYVDKHNLLQYFTFNATVMLVDKAGDEYIVTYKIGEEIQTKTFKYVLLATGLLSKPRDPLKHKEKFQGKSLHSAYYRDNSIFEGKNVVVIGKSYSAGDIAGDAVKTAKSVTQVYNHKTACVPKFINGIPYDFYFFNFTPEPGNPPLQCTIERNAEMIRAVNNLVGNPGELCEDWRLTDEEIDTEYVNCPVSGPDYYEYVKLGKINMVKGKAVEYTEKGILLEDGREVQADLIITATGFYSNYEYLSDSIKEILKYDPEDIKLPVVLCKSVFHPSLPGFAIVGKIYSLIVAELETTAEIGVRWVKELLG